MADSARTLGLFRGVLEDGDARPVVGARIAFEGADEQATSGPDGGFGLALAAGAGTAFLRVSDRGREYRVAAARDETDRVRVVLVPPDGVPLRVLTPGSSPVPRRFGWQALRRTETGLEPGPVGIRVRPALRRPRVGSGALRAGGVGGAVPADRPRGRRDRRGDLPAAPDARGLAPRLLGRRPRAVTPVGEPRAGALVTARSEGARHLASVRPHDAPTPTPEGAGGSRDCPPADTRCSRARRRCDPRDRDDDEPSRPRGAIGRSRRLTARRLAFARRPYFPSALRRAAICCSSAAICCFSPSDGSRSSAAFRSALASS